MWRLNGNLPIICHVSIVWCEAERNPPIIFHILLGSVARLCGTNLSYSMFCLSGARLNGTYQSHSKFCCHVRIWKEPTTRNHIFYVLFVRCEAERNPNYQLDSEGAASSESGADSPLKRPHVVRRTVSSYLQLTNRSTKGSEVILKHFPL
jgi:hypothetical protein